MHDPRSVIFLTAISILGAVPVGAGQNTYIQRNLVSSIAGAADRQETRLVNAWGIDRSATGPWWVNAADSGLSFVYDAAGKSFPAASPLVVAVNKPDGSASSPTGIVFNGTQEFALAPGMRAVFIFVTEDGIVAGWNPAVSPSTAIVKVNKPGEAIYKGVALGQVAGTNYLYAANFHSGFIDVYNASFAPVTLSAHAFRDAAIPPGYAPFNVQNIGGNLAVMFAKQDEDREDEVAGKGLGFVDIFTPAGELVRRLHHGPWMNAPWGVALAPEDFGKFGGKLLVGNFGSGEIAAFDPESGEYRGLLKGADHKKIAIDGLWGIGFGNGATAGPKNVLYFAAGPNDEEAGLFGTLTVAPGKGHDDDDDDDDK